MAVATLLREFALKMFSFVTKREPEKSRSGAAGAFRLRKMLRRDKVAHAGSTIQFSDSTMTPSMEEKYLRCSLPPLPGPLNGWAGLLSMVDRGFSVHPPSEKPLCHTCTKPCERLERYFDA